MGKWSIAAIRGIKYGVIVIHFLCMSVKDLSN